MNRARRPATSPLTWGTGGVAVVVLGWCLAQVGASIPQVLTRHGQTVLLLLLAVVIGEQVRLRMPSGRETAPLTSGSALAAAFLGPIAGEPVFVADWGVVVLVVGAGLAAASALRRLRGLPLDLHQLAPRLLGVAAAAWLARGPLVGPESLWVLQARSDTPLWLVAMAMIVVSAIGLAVELVLASAVRSERQHSPWPAALRDEYDEAAPLTLAVATSGPMVALMAPAFGLASLPAALVPLAVTYRAVRQYAHNRETSRQTIATLAHITEHGGYTRPAHAERVCDLSIRIGRVLGLSDTELRDVEYAALLHDLGQLSLREPIPGGATVLAAPADQRDIAAEGAHIIRRAGGLDAVADIVEAQPTPYRLVRELDEPVPLASRIIKVANAFDDLTGGRAEPADVEAAFERIHLGLGYEYDPEVVDALAVVTADGSLGRVEAARPARAATR